MLDIQSSYHVTWRFGDGGPGSEGCLHPAAYFLEICTTSKDPMSTEDVKHAVIK